MTTTRKYPRTFNEAFPDSAEAAQCFYKCRPGKQQRIQTASDWLFAAVVAVTIGFVISGCNAGPSDVQALRDVAAEVIAVQAEAAHHNK